MRFSIILVTISLIFIGCFSRSALIDSRLYFGLSQNYQDISTDDFITFLDSVITPRFPDGLTWYNAFGQWKDSSGTVIKEKSIVVDIIHGNTSEESKKIDEIRALYKKRFNQSSVLLVEEHPKISF